MLVEWLILAQGFFSGWMLKMTKEIAQPENL